jgi:hypothetical protein
MIVRRSLFALALALAGCKSSDPHPEVVDASHIDATIDASRDAPASCVDPITGCFKTDVCDPVQLDDFLNACTTAQCIQFDNEARLPLYNHGTLPPLP